MHGSLNIDNDIAGRLDSVEICLVIVKDCVQNFHSLKGIFQSRKIKRDTDPTVIINAHGPRLPTPSLGR